METPQPSESITGQMPDPIDPFAGAITFYEDRYYMFSNFSAFSIRYNDRIWPTAEHLYQALKFSSERNQEIIRNQNSAHSAKKAARERSVEYRNGWAATKVETMRMVCRLKLEQHKYIQEKLMETGDRLIIEASPKDPFWGWGPNKDGANYLGRVWMALRAEWKLLRTDNEHWKQLPPDTHPT